MLTSDQHLLCAAACITDQQGRYLLVRTPLRGWEFPGGVVETGESLTAGLMREVAEESGYIVRPERLLSLMSNVSSTPPKLIALFSAKLEAGELQTSDETPEVGWFSSQQAEKMVTHPANALRWQVGNANQAGVYYVVYRMPPFEIIQSSHL
jgi:8-oxo-dGTP diphosphatase